MKKLVVAGAVLLVLAAAGAAAYRTGWLAKLPIPALGRLAGAPAPGGAAAGTVPGTPPAGVPAAPGAAATGAPAGSSQPPAASATDATGAPLIAPPPFDGNVASLDYGGTVETWTTNTNDSPDHQEAIDGNKETNWLQWSRYASGPAEVVLSFFAREPMLVDRAVFVHPRVTNGAVPSLFPKEVEVWASMAETPDGPFQKVTSATLPDLPHLPSGEATVTFPPIEARFLKIRALADQGGKQDFLVAEVKVMEAQRPGYTPLLTRHPELTWAGGPNGAPKVPTMAGTTPPCAASAAATEPPAHPESRKVILLGEWRGMHLAGAVFENSKFPKGEEGVARHRVEFKLAEKDVMAMDDGVPAEERGVLTRGTFRFVSPKQARPALLAPALGYDTVVIAQMCNSNNRMQAVPKAFKQALMPWVAAGHKLIIQDSDDCVPGPDYSFVPFRFKTDTPGARGAAGFNLRFVEANQMLQSREGRPGFLDAEAWVENKRRHRNELGDANTFVGWDGNWCGHLAVRNVHGVMGFALAYARYGRGLIIYDGFDNDQNFEHGYDEVVIRELAQPFGPDNLPCGARLGDFVVTTPTNLLQRAAVPGRTYTYPLTLLSNLGYSGSVNLSASAAGGVQGIDTKFEPAAVTLGAEGSSTFSVTLPQELPAPSFALEVKGSDAAGKSSALCLQFAPPTTGELSVVSALAPPTKTRKNLEIILDASGSMKTALAGKQTRWDVALGTLDEVLANLPADFNVGLRMYGHRESSRSPRTCTDSELLVPIRKIDRNLLARRARQFKPKGETPLVYSALQSPADLKAVGGGTVILITDGEESCRGDAVKAAADLKASGLDIRLNIVGFALKNPKVQRDLSGFAQATGGLFYAAESGTALADALMVAAVEKFPYTVHDAAGKVVLSGDAGSGADPLPAGDYKVVVKAGTKELVAPRVTIVPGQSVTLTIAMKNGQLTMQ